MRKFLALGFVFISMSFSVTSCKSKSAFIEKTIALDSIVETAKDTIVNVPKDSSSYVAELGTNDKGDIVIKQVNEAKSGRKLTAPKVTIRNNLLEVDCVAEAEALFFSWKEKFIKSYREHQKPIITNVLNWWQKTQIYIGRTALAIFLLWLLLLLFNFKKF